MTLTDEQLQDLMDKMSKEKRNPLRLIRELYPEEERKAVKKQFYDKFGVAAIIDMYIN